MYNLFELRLMIDVSPKSKAFIEKEKKYGAHNYHPLDVVLCRGEGVFVWDVDGKRYYDFLSAYSAVNQGHCHPRIVKRLEEQARKLNLCSRAFHSNVLGEYEEYMHHYFGYDKLLPMNSGAEAVETGLKLARRWGYQVKGIKEDRAIIVVMDGNFHGRTISIVSMSTDPSSYKGYGPYTPGFIQLPFGDFSALERCVEEEHEQIAAVLLEPIQGEAGVIVPPPHYIKQAYTLCKENNILFMADEIQTGLGRTGELLCCYHEDVRPDIVLLGKALSGGLIPVSAVLADDEVILCIQAGEHGSTFGGYPTACAVAMEALQVLKDEKLPQNAAKMGSLFREELSRIQSPFIKEIRGKGLLNAVEIAPYKGKTAWEVCEAMAANGLLAKPTHEHTIRFAPPLCITRAQIEESCDIIKKSILSLE